MPEEQAEAVVREWIGRARSPQYPLWRRAANAPATWLVIGGRGAGKTVLGAEFVNGLVHGFSPFGIRHRYGSIALVGESFADLREVMIDGPSGVRTLARGSRPRFEATRRRLVWTSGAVAHLFSAEDPESLRGPQFEAAWCDELAKFRQMEAVWDMLQFGLRLGPRPVQLVTTTPRHAPLIRRLMTDAGVHLTRMRTDDNIANLAPGFVRAMRARYGGTRLGRQELDGDLVAEREDALWSRATIEAAAAPRDWGGPGRIVVAVDPPAGSTSRSDACGIVVAGRIGADRAVVVADGTVRRARPHQWAARAVELYRRFGADCIVAEINQGGDMVATVIHGVDAAVPVRTVRANRGKWLRAEPVAALYEQGRVAHAARFAELEDEMADFGPDGLSSGRSPDRLDALVWAITELLLAGRGEPRVRTVGE